MIKSKKIFLNGLELYLEDPNFNKKTAFLESKGARIQVVEGYIQVTGNFTLNPNEVADFLKTLPPTAASAVQPHAPAHAASSTTQVPPASRNRP